MALSASVTVGSFWRSGLDKAYAWSIKSDPGGIFIFDLNTQYKSETLAINIAEVWEGMSFTGIIIFRRERIKEYSCLRLQRDDGDTTNLWNLISKSLWIEQIKEAIENGGLEFVGVYDLYKRAARENSGGCILLRRKRKGGTNSRWKTKVREPLQRIRCGILHLYKRSSRNSEKGTYTSPVATAALGRLLTAGAMMGSMCKNDSDMLTLKVECDGPIGGLW